MSSNDTSPWEEVGADQAAQYTPERDDNDPWQIDGADPWSNYDTFPQPEFGEPDYSSPHSAPYSQPATSSRLNPNARPFSGPVTHGGTGD